jgi:hypothetical protein
MIFDSSRPDQRPHSLVAGVYGEVSDFRKRLKKDEEKLERGDFVPQASLNPRPLFWLIPNTECSSFDVFHDYTPDISYTMACTVIEHHLSRNYWQVNNGRNINGIFDTHVTHDISPDRGLFLVLVPICWPFLCLTETLLP